MQKYLEVKQNGYKDCGPSCLLSLIRYYGGNASIEELSLLLRTDNNGTTAYNLINGAKQLGFDGYGIKYTYEEIINSSYSFPIITHVLTNNMYHFIVIYGSNNKNTLYVMDPAIGNKKMKFEEFKKIYLGTSIVLYPVKKLAKLDNVKNITKYLFEYLYECKSEFVKFLFLSIITVLLSIVCSYYLQIVIDYILPYNSHEYLYIISYLFINIYIFNDLLTYIKNKYLIKITNNIGIRLNNETIRHLFNLPYQFFKNKSTGEVLTRVVDIKNLKSIIENTVINIAMNVILIALSMIVLFIINNKLFLISFVSLTLYYLVVKVYSHIFKKDIECFQLKDEEYNKTLTEAIEGYETNKNINMTNYVVKKLEKMYIVYSKKYSMFKSSMNNQVYLKNIVMNISYVITMYFGLKYVMLGSLSLGNFIVFNSLLSYFIEPIKDILDLEPNINYMKNIYNRINDILIMKSNPISHTDVMVQGDILFNNVGYGYNSLISTFNGVSLKIKYGSKYLIYGKSGSGKSTLLKLLLKYLNDYKGDIKIGYNNLKDIDNSIIASSFTYVSQNNYINNDTIKNNIIYDRNINNYEYENMLKICNVDRVRDSKELRNDFMIEDNGFNISGGERQKIILARALLKKSNYIILDEALSEVGLEEEKDILNKILNYFYDKTIIYISHKKEIIDLFENIYYLERSKA